MTVWVVHPVKDDLSAALQYGEIKYITEGYVHGDELEQEDKIPKPVAMKLFNAARDFDSFKDYFLIVGDHLQIVQFTANLVAYRGAFRVLRYDRQAQGYFPVFIES